MRRVHLPLLALLIALPLAASAGWLDWLGNKGNELLKSDSTNASLSDSEVVQGLKQALDKGVRYAVDRLGRPGGFLDDARVRIPMPEKLAWADSALHRIGQGKLADDFVASMNHAAEKAVPATLQVFKQALSRMTLQDARQILNGPDDAATQYFRRVSGSELAAKIRPLVSEATGKVGVTRRYKKLVAKADIVPGLVERDDLDLDGYVTDKALDGVFLMVADEEKRIRKDPVARTTELLKKVFAGH